MTLVAEQRAAPPVEQDRWRPRWRRWRARNPESVVVVVAIAAWVGMAAVHWGNHDAPAITGSTASPGIELTLWALMTVAMMVPGTIGMVRRLALDSLLSRRQRNIALFMLVYVGTWTAVAGLLLAVERLAAAVLPGLDLRSTVVLVVTLVGASAWQLTKHKHQWLNACHLRGRLAPRGRAADRSVIAYGVRHARACVGSCWLIMTAMFVAGHDFHLMVPLAVITTYERWVKRPQHAASAAALLSLAVLTAFGLL